MTIDYTNTWENISSWRSVLPPSRPDKWQIDIIQKNIENFSKKNRVAVLGSTIEYRELLARMGFSNVYVFERNIAFFEYITPCSSIPLHESLVEGNWLDSLSLFPGMFDIILSDLTSGNIPYDLRDRFYQGISRSLTPNGLFVDRILRKISPLIPLNELINKYKKKVVDQKNVNKFNCEVLFCSSLLEKTSGIVDVNEIYDYLLMLNIPRITEFVHACYEITPRNCLWWYYMEYEKELELYNKYFVTITNYSEPIDSEYYNRANLLLSRRR